ncbi:hypothetical protein I4U23_021859 [Adineta vaga]|nr:hypothetical protein I4U23_021859 [Adineta vaga]
MSSKENLTAIHVHGEERITGTVILFLSYSVLAACIYQIVISKTLKNKYPVPFTVAVLLLGFIAGIIGTQMKNVHNNFLTGEIELSEINPHLIYYIFLPLLIFDSAFNGHFHIVKKQLLSAIILAGPGVLITTVIIAISGVYIFPYNWSWLIGLLFGSILSATDTVAVVALLHNSGASNSLISLIDSESLLNDGSAFVTFLILNNMIVSGEYNTKKIVTDIIKYTVGGPVFGFLCGLICVFILNRINNELEIEITFTFGLAYLVFYIADVELKVSAVLALVVMGLYMAKHKYCISSHVQLPMTSAWRIATYIINILIFTITGIILAKSLISTSTSITARDFGFSILLYFIIHVGRALTIFVLYPLIYWSGVHLSWRECIVLMWSSLRGSMALIIVLIVYLYPKIDEVTRDRLLFHVSMIVLLTLVINGTSSKFLVKFLGLHRGTKESQIVLLQALEHMRHQTSCQLSKMKRDENFVDVDWKMLNAYLPDKLLEELDEERETTIHQQLSQNHHDSSTIILQTSRTNMNIEQRLSTVPIIHKVDSKNSNNPILRRTSSSAVNDTILSVLELIETGEKRRQNIRKELITRFLTAMSIDYEKQWHLGMICRRTLDILIKSVEQAKLKCSLNLHWQLIVEHFQMSIVLLNLMRFDYFNFINQWTNKLFLNHIFLTIELTLGFHSAKIRMDSIQLKFPELANIDREIMDEVCEEAKSYQINATHVLLDLKQSYPLCWMIQMTKRCAQMLLKYESIAIIQLYETGMLGDSEYSHILQLIEQKLFVLEYGNIKISTDRKKMITNSFDMLSLFQQLSENEKEQWRSIMKPYHKWFQPNTILLRNDQIISTAYLIVRGIVEQTNHTVLTYYKSGHILGIDRLFSQKLSSHGTYTASSGLVEVYAIDIDLLNRLIADDKLSRSIYNEIAVHVFINNYQTSLELNHLQLQLLLDNKAIFYKNKCDLSIHLKANDRLLLLAGTLTRHLEQNVIRFDSIELLFLDVPTIYELNSSSIVYTWTHDDEIYCTNIDKFNRNVPTHHSEFITSVEPFYPRYSGETVEFSPWRHSLQMTRPVENLNNFQLIPSEIVVDSNTNLLS